MRDANSLIINNLHAFSSSLHRFSPTPKPIFIPFFAQNYAKTILVIERDLSICSNVKIVIKWSDFYSSLAS
jgi:hypothetical protein